MNTEELKTWNFLKEFKLDDETSRLKFSDRLARENNWTKEFALACIEEYKKFVFLAKHAGHPVTPSVEVDEVWHLHMIYTRSYWDEMCKGIDFSLHHGPTKGGKAEGEKFTNWYSRTLISYNTFFGMAPSTYWPSEEIRFAPSTIKKIDTKKFFLIKKPSFKTSIAACCLPLFMLMGGFGTSLLVAATVVVVILILISVFRGERTETEREKKSRRRSVSSYSKKSSNKSNDDNSSGILSCSSCGSSKSSHNSSHDSHDSSHSDGGGDSGCGSSCGSSCGGGCGGD